MARGVGRWAIERRARATENHPAGEWEVAPLGRFGTREKAQRVIDRIVVPHDDMHDFRAREIGGAGGAESRKTVQVLLRVSPAARDAIDRVAERRGLDRSAMVAALALEADAAGRLPPAHARRVRGGLIPVRRRPVQRRRDARLVIPRGDVHLGVTACLPSTAPARSRDFRESTDDTLRAGYPARIVSVWPAGSRSRGRRP